MRNFTVIIFNKILQIYFLYIACGRASNALVLFLMGSSFYSIYIKGNFDPNGKRVSVGDLKKTSSGGMRCVKQGFSWINAIPYLNSMGALAHRCYFSFFVILCFSYLQMRSVSSIGYLFPGKGLDILAFLLLSWMSGLYFHAIIENEMLGKGNFLAGTYLAGNKEEALRVFFNLVNNS